VFTGIVEAVGRVAALDGNELRIERNSLLESAAIGDSVAVNGCCLTVASGDPHVGFHLSEETLARTSMGGLVAGSLVNLELAMRVDGRFGGHLVQGHVDGVGTVVGIEGERYRFRIPADGAAYVIEKGSIAVDGISLTVVEPMGVEFWVAVVPHTLSHTNLRERKLGDAVNLEYDVIAKMVERMVRVYAPPA